jgi:hypothetical protein
MFDPYSQWMSIPKGPRPPNHYKLLGIGADERNAAVIKEAALRLTEQVRVYQAGPQGELCTRLLNEIAQARAVLLNPKLREEYDARTAEPQAAPAAPIPVHNDGGSVAENRSRRVLVGRSPRFPVGSLLAALGYLLMVLAGAGVSFWVSQDRLKRTAAVHPGTGKARVPAPGGKPR